MVVRDTSASQVELFTVGLTAPGAISETGILVDVTLSEDHEWAAELTDSPAEDGSVVSDHRRVAPLAFRMSGIVTDTPLESTPGLLQFVATTTDEVQQLAEDIQNQLQQPRAQDVYAQLEDLFRRPILWMVATERRVFESMAMVALTVHRDPDTGRALAFDASFREVVFASTELTSVTLANTGQKSAPAKKNLGAKPTAPVAKEEESSVLFDLVKPGYEKHVETAGPLP